MKRRNFLNIVGITGASLLILPSVIPTPNEETKKIVDECTYPERLRGCCSKKRFLEYYEHMERGQCVAMCGTHFNANQWADLSQLCIKNIHRFREEGDFKAMNYWIEYSWHFSTRRSHRFFTLDVQELMYARK